jgi:hypothetical protein
MRKGKLKAMLRFLIEFRKPKVQSLQSDYFIDTVGGYLKLSWNVERCRKVKVNRHKFSSSAIIFIPFDSKKTTIKVSCRNIWRRSNYYVQLNPQMALSKQSEYTKKVKSLQVLSFKQMSDILASPKIPTSIMLISVTPRIEKKAVRLLSQNISINTLMKSYEN